MMLDPVHLGVSSMLLLEQMPILLESQHQSLEIEPLELE